MTEENIQIGSIDQGLIEELTLLTYLSEVDEKTFTGDTELLHKLNGAKQKLGSIDDIITVVKSVNKILDERGASEKRGWVHKLQNIHPKVQSAIKDLKYFKEVSDEVGSRFIGYTVDTPSLDLENWASDKPQSVRENIKYKVKSTDMIEDAYHKLNGKMYNNISNEFITERDRYVQQAMINWGLYQTEDGSSINIVAHDFHIAGDVSYVEKISETVSVILDLIILQLDGTEYLINSIKPVNNSRKAKPGDYNVNVEGNPEKITINFKGDRIVNLGDELDQSKLQPEIE